MSLEQFDRASIVDLLKKRYPDETWLVGGPYPAVSVCVCVDPGCGFPEPEPPVWEPIAILSNNVEGEQSQIALGNAEFIVGAAPAINQLLQQIDVYERALAILPNVVQQAVQVAISEAKRQLVTERMEILTNASEDS